MDNTKCFTTIGKSHSAQCRPASKEEWERARNDDALKKLCHQIEQTDDPELQRKLKSKLPVWTPRCAEFSKNHRAEKDAIAPLRSRLMLDIDEKGHTDEILALLSDGCIGPFRVLMIEESVRHGTHVMVLKPADMDENEVQAKFSDIIGLKVDPAVKNVAGCIYMVPKENERYVAEEFRDPPQPSLKGGRSDTSEPTSSTQPPATTFPLIRGTEGDLSFPTAYSGIPYSLIVSELQSQLGGKPAHGARNNFIFSMACHLRYVCDDNPQWIAQILPTFGEDKNRAYATIKSACNRAQSRKMPAVVLRALDMARIKATCANQGGTYSDDYPPAMPKALPALIRLLTSKVDPMYKPAVAMAVFPALGAHLHGVRVRYIDNFESDLGGFMSVLMAEQSIGKACVNMPIEMIMEDVRKRDALSREILARWNEEWNRSKATKTKPERPKDVAIQYLMSNMTNAALVNKLLDAEDDQGKFLYTRMDEIDQLDQIQATGGLPPDKIICLAFNQALYGQERVGHESVNGTPPLRFNFNASTTIPRGQSYFRNGLTDGTLTRLSLSTIVVPEHFRGIPKYGIYDDKFKADLKPFIDNLNAANGLIRCPQAERMAFRLLDENQDIIDLSDDNVFRILSYRANKITYDRAMLLYIANGYKWNPTISSFCRWAEQYDLWCKIHFFGDEMEQQTKEKPVATKGPSNMLDMIPDRFTKLDLETVHKAQGKTGKVSALIYKWTYRGYIEKDESTKEYYKTKKYLANHK